MFLVVYRWEPDTSVRWRSAIYGAVFAGVAWTIAKELYRLYLEPLANFSKLYGSLGSVIILILWIYYSSMIMVLGAELAYVNEHGPSEEPEEAERLEKGSQPNG
jgi:membrane protein